MDRRTFDETYKQIQKIGKGGTGQIYLAYQANLEKRVVLKQFQSRFEQSFIRREVDILKNLKHRYLPQIYDFIELEGSYFIVEEYISGYDLGYYLKQGAVIPEKTILKWLVQLCDVLEYLHTRNPAVIHSDIKPSNIMIDANGDVCLIDFNISVLNGESVSVLGYSRNYCAPEQMYKAANPGAYISINATTDIYSTAATFYALMSKRVPSAMKRNLPLAEMRLQGYSMKLCRVLDVAMDPDQRNRWQSAQEFRRQLNQSSPYAKDRRKQRVYIMSAIAGCLVIGIFAAVLIVAGLQSDRSQRLESAVSKINRTYVSAGATNEVYLQIQSLLSDKENREALDDNALQAAQLYAMLGEYHDSQGTANGDSAAVEAYETAYQYIKKTSAGNELVAEYAMNYASALCKAGKTSLAEQVVSADFPASADTLLSKTLEIFVAYYEDRDDDVLSLSESVPTGDSYPGVRVRLYKLIAAAAVDCGQPVGAQWMENVLTLDRSSSMRRYAAEYYVTLGAKTNDQTCFQKAEQLFSGLSEQIDSDQVGLAEAKLLQGKTSEAAEILNGFSTNDIVLQCRANYLHAGVYAAQGNAGGAAEYCERAIACYDQMTIEQKQKVDYQAIEELKEASVK